MVSRVQMSFRWNVILRLSHLGFIAAVMTAVNTAGSLGCTSWLLVGYGLLACGLPLYANQQAEVMERALFAKLLAAGPKQLAQDNYVW
jgi:hypothetical protein